MDLKKRTPEEVWVHHNTALAARNIQDFILDFSDDCIFINNPNGGHASGVYHGPNGVAEWCEMFFTLFDEIKDFVTAKAFFESNIVMVEWDIDSKKFQVAGGVDTFIIKDGQFCTVTVVYDVHEKGGRL